MNAAIVAAVALIIIGALYIRLRWWRSPQAYRAMMALAVGYFVAGALAGAWLFSAAPKPADVSAPVAVSSAVAPMLKENYTGPIHSIPPLHFDPKDAARCLIPS